MLPHPSHPNTCQPPALWCCQLLLVLRKHLLQHCEFIGYISLSSDKEASLTSHHHRAMPGIKLLLLEELLERLSAQVVLLALRSWKLPLAACPSGAAASSHWPWQTHSLAKEKSWEIGFSVISEEYFCSHVFRTLISLSCKWGGERRRKTPGRVNLSDVRVAYMVVASPSPVKRCRACVWQRSQSWGNAVRYQSTPLAKLPNRFCPESIFWLSLIIIKPLVLILGLLLLLLSCFLVVVKLNTLLSNFAATLKSRILGFLEKSDPDER